MNKQKIIKENSVQSSIRIIDALNLLDKLSIKTLLVHSSDKFFGTLTDGDIRRGLIDKVDINDSIKSITNQKCQTISHKDFQIENFSRYFGQIDIVPVIKNSQISDIYININQKFSKNNLMSLKNKCDVVVMAGGKGTRMKPLTDFIPKPLVPLHGKTLIEHVMENFSNFEINNFSISVNYKSQQIINHFKDQSHFYDLNYLHEDIEMGTIGALQNFDFNNRPVFVANCDSLIDLDYYDMYKFHKDNNFDFTVAGCEDVINVPYGVCSVDKNFRLTEIKEKPQIVNLINSGLYLCGEKAASLIPKNVKFHATDLISSCQKNNFSVGVYRFRKDQWRDVGIFSEYLSYL
jgi:dTDP-glucose pyrophosphorylase